MEHDPFAMVGKITESVENISTSPEIYENIDVFKPSKEVKVRLGLFGCYSYSVLKRREFVQQIDMKVCDLVRQKIGEK